MAVSFLTNTDRVRLESVPSDISNSDLSHFFTLSTTDIALIPESSNRHNRVGFALQLCLLRYIGYFPTNLTATPIEALNYLSKQLGTRGDVDISQYGIRAPTRTHHQRQIILYLGFQRLDADSQNKLAIWLGERALEHDKPTLLFQLVCEKLLLTKILRPGVTVLEKMIGQARNSAVHSTFEALEPIINENKYFLDSLLVSNDDSWRTQLHWLKSCSPSNSAAAIKESLKKLALLHSHGVHRWNTSKIMPNRMRHLYELAKRSTNQALSRSRPERRYPIFQD